MSTSRKVYNNILDLIGNTPLIKLRRIRVKPGVEIWGKLEAANPGGSIKDRIALSMIEDAEKKGVLTRDKIVAEASSGNTGIGLAMVCAVKGYRCLIAMPESASIERRKIMQAYGAEILLTPAEKGTDGAIEAIYELVRTYPDRYFNPDQFNNPANWQMHYRTTGPEIWRDTEGRVTHVVASMGTTGTLMGLARYFREKASHVNVIGVEPLPGHKIQGLKNMKESYPPGIYDKKLPHQIVNVEDEEAYELARRLAREEGILVGMSSGAALAGALKIAREIEEGLIVVIFPDGGERYLSTPLWVFPEPPRKEDFRLTNTLSGKKEVFEPLESGKVKIYTCGPTLNRRPHLGLYRRMLTADILRRYLEYRGLSVTHVVNLTDFDDKTIAAAEAAGRPLKELTEELAQEFFEDLGVLRIKPATHYPRVSEHVEDMLALTRELLRKGLAYEKYSSIYFDVSKLPDYGRLSGVETAALKPGVTVDLDEYEKDSPADFTLFKRVSILELKQGYFVDTEWGKVRPGWHIQCAALSMKYLGESFDIHTSGTDLLFPHHENERAIARALTGKELARFWIHSALVLFEGRKMSVSAGNEITLADLRAKGFRGREIRFFLLRSHYRKPLNFTWKALEEARKALSNLIVFCALLHNAPLGSEAPEVLTAVEELREGFEAAMNDDLNTPQAVAELFRFSRRLYPWVSERGLSEGTRMKALEVLLGINQVLDILVFPEEIRSEEIQEVLSEREAARRAGDYETADRLREELRARGYLVLDTPAGTRVFRLPDE
ncbi:cysteine--tRNA ligase [Thermosulfurimonas dismutans]|uniref:Cysteine--tRNA ligase n=1 Tax=Thermosulfurimonas dismutans TaxID=999894 RepID=A0A179D184_9BACT|nr:cysteine--tRNA ligase [Thermosulfurimonas dismutans]OAQ19825.1 Cysteinyl-tRNA synthetase [Thermosulfurimonas dismutans]